MSEGYLLDRSDNARLTQQRWIEGEPQRSFWLGLSTKGREAFQVTTWRCDKCGFLESFAETPVK